VYHPAILRGHWPGGAMFRGIIIGFVLAIIVVVFFLVQCTRAFF